MLTIIGVDPGLAETGVGIIRGFGKKIQSYAFGCIRTAAGTPLPQRLHQIHRRIQETLDPENPDLVVLEDVFSLPRYPKSGITLGQVSGVIMLAGANIGTRMVEVPVREAKQVLTGNGNASKMQLEMAIRRILRRGEAIRPDHASDALGLAVIGLYRYEMLDSLSSSRKGSSKQTAPGSRRKGQRKTGN